MKAGGALAMAISALPNAASAAGEDEQDEA